MTETAFPMPNEPLKRCAIVGTAPSWKQTPWHDLSLEVFGLNDAYVLGQPRANAWFDLHPTHRWFMYDKANLPTIDQVPAGTYMRPKGHREWLAKQATLPIFLLEKQGDIPTSVTFPKDAILDFWRPYWPYRVDAKGVVNPGPDYEVSSPAWMYMWAVANGYREIHIYGIHLSTEWEYLQQRPNLEFLMGVGAGLGVKHVLPTAAPLCKGKFQYGYDVKNDAALEPTQRRIDAAKYELAHLAKLAKQAKWYETGRKADLASRKRVVEVELMDAQMVLRQLQQKAA